MCSLMSILYIRVLRNKITKVVTAIVRGVAVCSAEWRLGARVIIENISVHAPLDDAVEYWNF